MSYQNALVDFEYLVVEVENKVATVRLTVLQ